MICNKAGKGIIQVNTPNRREELWERTGKP
jgi:hypothetical protein